MSERYSATSMALHWAMAGLMAGAFILGEVMEDMPRGPEKLSVMGWHILAGLIIAALVLPRLLARRSAPPLPATMPGWERRLAAAGHVVLYGVMILLPVAGLLAVVSGGRAFPVLGLFSIPNFMPSEGLHDRMEAVHGAAAKLFLIMVALHVAATVGHLVRRDGIAKRMLP